MITVFSKLGRRFAMTAVAGVLAVGSNVHAQEVFELGDEGFTRVEGPAEGTTAGRIQAIRRALAAKDFETAEEMASEWIQTYTRDPQLPEAYLLRGDALVGQNEFYKSLYDYEIVVRGYPESSHFHIALEREFKVAQAFCRGTKRKLWGMRFVPAGGEGEELFIRIQERSPGSKIAERSGIELADYYYREQEMLLAAEAYNIFLENFPNSQWREHAMSRLVHSNLATVKGPRFDATGLLEARRRLQDYKISYPAAAQQIDAEALLARIDESLAEKMYLTAEWYQRKDEDVSAKLVYKRVIRDHPRTAAARKALERLKRLDPEFMKRLSKPERAAPITPQSPAGS